MILLVCKTLKNIFKCLHTIEIINASERTGGLIGRLWRQSGQWVVTIFDSDEDEC